MKRRIPDERMRVAAKKQRRPVQWDTVLLVAWLIATLALQALIAALLVIKL